MSRARNNPGKDFHKSIRNLLDTKKYSQIIQSIRTFNGSGGKISIDTISNVFANGDKIFSDSFSETLDYLLGLTNESNYTELTFTSLIRLFSLPDFYDLDKIHYYYNLMKKNSVVIKRRTLTPIFKNLESIDQIIYFYTDSKIQGIVLSIDDYINIFMKKIPVLYQNIIIEDMVNNIDQFLPEEYQEKINAIFQKKEEEPNLQKYVLSQKESGKLTEKMKIYISHFYSKNTQLLEKISKSMKTLKKMKYDIVIDGANVGFYKRGILSGKKVCFNQISSLASLFESKGKRVLIIIHNHHIEKADLNEKKIIKNINSNQKINLFVVPKGSDDDWFWLFASLSNMNSYLVTNDEMRNHFYYMNLDNSFQHWKETRVINYDLDTQNNFSLVEPYPYLKKIQINLKNGELAIPFIKKDTQVFWQLFSF